MHVTLESHFPEELWINFLCTFFFFVYTQYRETYIQTILSQTWCNIKNKEQFLFRRQHWPLWSFIRVRIQNMEISANLKIYSFSLHRMKQMTTFYITHTHTFLYLSVYLQVMPTTLKQSCLWKPLMLSCCCGMNKNQIKLESKKYTVFISISGTSQSYNGFIFLWED